MSIHHLRINDLTVSYNRVPALHHINLEIGWTLRRAARA
jgi:ABC-type Mn2+/Zn2+ transport system ATPase subunit